MSASARRQTHMKGAATRQRLLEAAVTCLWKYGYAGTTLTSVAREAGMSRGPQQYYFPTRVDLMVGVWDYVSTQMELHYSVMGHPSLSRQEKLQATVEAAIEWAGSKAHIAELELKLATRGDPDLRAVLQDLINARESATDAVWSRFFGEPDVAEADLTARRYAIVGMIHGLAIERISGRPQALLTRMEQELRQMAQTALSRRPKTRQSN